MVGVVGWMWAVGCGFWGVGYWACWWRGLGFSVEDFGEGGEGDGGQGGHVNSGREGQDGVGGLVFVWRGGG